MIKSEDEFQTFLNKYTKKPFLPSEFFEGQKVEGFIGLDGGSTSTKAVLLDKNKNILVKSYQLSKGNPIEDTKDVFYKLREQVEIRVTLDAWCRHY